MADSFVFWMMKPLSEIAFGIAVFMALAAVMSLWQLPRWWKQKRCRHLRYFETGSCDAICRDCGKNLGFIGTVRDAKGVSK